MGGVPSVPTVCSAAGCVPLAALNGAQLLGLALVLAISLFTKPPRQAPPQILKVAQTLEDDRSLNKPPLKKAPAHPNKSKQDQEAEEEEESLTPQAKVGIIIREAREQIGVDCIKHYNFAVSGQTGVGKSSFINAILSLEGKACAPVGEVETTQEIKCYSCQKWPTLKLWDIPGAGTRKHPSATYFEDKKLYVFDAILILTADRFLDVDFHILRSARKFKTPCVFVRTKCDISLENRVKREKINALQASQRLRAEVSQSFHEGLANAGLISGASSSERTPHLYFISNMFFEDEDAYSIYDKKAKALDCSLPSMDEHALITFLLDAAKIRA